MGFRPFYMLKSGRGLCRLEIKGEFVALTVCKIKAGLKISLLKIPKWVIKKWHNTS